MKTYSKKLPYFQGRQEKAFDALCPRKITGSNTFGSSRTEAVSSLTHLPGIRENSSVDKHSRPVLAQNRNEPVKKGLRDVSNTLRPENVTRKKSHSVETFPKPSSLYMGRFPSRKPIKSPRVGPQRYINQLRFTANVNGIDQGMTDSQESVQESTQDTAFSSQVTSDVTDSQDTAGSQVTVTSLSALVDDIYSEDVTDSQDTAGSQVSVTSLSAVVDDIYSDSTEEVETEIETYSPGTMAITKTCSPPGLTPHTTSCRSEYNSVFSEDDEEWPSIEMPRRDNKQHLYRAEVPTTSRHSHLIPNSAIKCNQDFTEDVPMEMQKPQMRLNSTLLDAENAKPIEELSLFQNLSIITDDAGAELRAKLETTPKLTTSPVTPRTPTKMKSFSTAKSGKLKPKSSTVIFNDAQEQRIIAEDLPEIHPESVADDIGKLALSPVTEKQQHPLKFYSQKLQVPSRKHSGYHGSQETDIGKQRKSSTLVFTDPEKQKFIQEFIPADLSEIQMETEVTREHLTEEIVATPKLRTASVTQRKRSSCEHFVEIDTCKQPKCSTLVATDPKQQKYIQEIIPSQLSEIRVENDQSEKMTETESTITRPPSYPGARKKSLKDQHKKGKLNRRVSEPEIKTINNDVRIKDSTEDKTIKHKDVEETTPRNNSRNCEMVKFTFDSSQITWNIDGKQHMKKEDINKFQRFTSTPVTAEEPEAHKFNGLSLDISAVPVESFTSSELAVYASRHINSDEIRIDTPEEYTVKPQEKSTTSDPKNTSGIHLARALVKTQKRRKLKKHPSLKAKFMHPSLKAKFMQRRRTFTNTNFYQRIAEKKLSRVHKAHQADEVEKTQKENTSLNCTSSQRHRTFSDTTFFKRIPGKKNCVRDQDIPPCILTFSPEHIPRRKAFVVQRKYYPEANMQVPIDILESLE